MNWMNDQHWKPTVASSTLTTPTLQEMAEMMDKLRPPPRREFECDGMIHAIYEDGVMRVSEAWFHLIKAKCKPAPNAAPLDALSGMALIVDETLPRLAPLKFWSPKFWPPINVPT